MKTPEHWIDETPGVIHDEEHRNDLLELYAKIQYDAASQLPALQKENAELKDANRRANAAIGDTSNELQEIINSLRTQNRELREMCKVKDEALVLVLDHPVVTAEELFRCRQALALQPEK